jgi:hypothetical protein
MPFGQAFKPATADPFYRFNQFQKDPAFDWTKTQAIGGNSGYLEQQPDAAYTRWLGSLGVGLSGASAFDDYVQNYVRNQSQNAYKAALAEDPTLKYQDYLNTLGSLNDLHRRFAGLTARQRGVYPQGPTRVIADI